MSKSFIYETLQRVRLTGINPLIESLGNKLYKAGEALQGDLALKPQKNYVLYKESNQGVKPAIENSFVSPSNIILGNVTANNTHMFFRNTLKTHSKNSSIKIG